MHKLAALRRAAVGVKRAYQIIRAEGDGIRVAGFGQG